MFTITKYKYHLIAILTVMIWGITFVSTKVLITNGLSPIEILVYRFAIAYIGIWFICPRKIFANNIKDELLCIVAGMGGGSLYFLFENTALKITLASNVSLIICTAPLFTALLTSLFYRKERIKKHFIIGSAIALMGVACVVFNGSFILKINPLGDLLTILAALSWAFYGVVLRKLNPHYHTLFLTRKVFFYGILTILPFVSSFQETFHPNLLGQVNVIINLLFLGVAASLLCYAMWGSAVKNLGVVQTTNYVYLVPLITLITSAIFINEPIAIVAGIGALCILTGVYIAEKGIGKVKRGHNRQI